MICICHCWECNDAFGSCLTASQRLNSLVSPASFNVTLLVFSDCNTSLAVEQVEAEILYPALAPPRKWGVGIRVPDRHQKLHRQLHLCRPVVIKDPVLLGR